MDVDVIIFGGGAAGLWLLDDLRRRGAGVVLLEAAALGSGQTIASQGIIHGGLKYTLGGLLSGSAANIREMPGIWRDCLAGRRAPDLSGVRVRSEFCHLWHSDSARSRLGMIGARFGLRVVPEELATDERPEVLRRCPGTVARLAEQVISPGDFLTRLAQRHRCCILQIDAEKGLRIETETPGSVRAVHLEGPERGDRLELRPAWVVFTAGAGNAELRRKAGFSAGKMQRRPLHMAMLRGDLPRLNGHCVDGARTRVTITSDRDRAGRTVWQVGGQLAEDGVAINERRLLQHCAKELQAVLPGADLCGVEGATYRVDRAERKTRFGRRPDDVQVLTEGNVVTAWPTKLALAPRLAEQIVRQLGPTESSSKPDLRLPDDWPRPPVADPPWETCSRWQAIGRIEDRVDDAA